MPGVTITFQSYYWAAALPRHWGGRPCHWGGRRVTRVATLVIGVRVCVIGACTESLVRTYRAAAATAAACCPGGERERGDHPGQHRGDEDGSAP